MKCLLSRKALLLSFLFIGNSAAPIFANINDNPPPNFDICTDSEELHLHGIDTDKLNVDEPNDDYNQLALLAQDEEMLKEMFGSFTGTVFSWMPISMIATSFIETARVSDCWNWLILDNNSRNTMGMVNLTEYKEHNNFLDSSYKGKRVFNFGGLLEQKYRRKGILNRVTDSMLPKVFELNKTKELNIDALIIETRIENVAINKLAKKLNFKFVGTYWKVIWLKQGTIELPIGVVEMNQYMLDINE